jgi:DNA invertase Pin-like site-specific DNA recombinase
MKTAAYIRVSTAGQNEAGQRLEIDRWLRGHNLTDTTYFIDKKSGDHLDRPAFSKLQAAVFNREIDAIVVYKLDRISRTLQDGINVLAEWCKAGVRVVSTSQQLDFSGATGQLIAAVLFAVAQMEQETRRERQAAGIAAARARGAYMGRKVGATKSAPQEACRLRARGFTDSEIAKQLGISRRTVQRYVRGTGDRLPSR